MGSISPTAQRIAVIGAGPGGLAAAKYLKAEKCFEVIDIFEQRASVAGVWVATPEASQDPTFTIPRTRPSKVPSQAHFQSTPDGNTKGPVFVSPVYDSLDTNIPHTLMNFSDFPFPDAVPLFPSHKIVRQYLEDYSVNIRHLIKFSTQVLDVKPVEGGRWWVTTKEVVSGKEEQKLYDAVIVSSGHYDDPYLPDIPGLVEWERSFPGSISHSKFYRRAEDYRGKKVVVVGNSASGSDISNEICKVSANPLLISERNSGTLSITQNPSIEIVGEITSFDKDNRSIHFSCGRIEKHIDYTLFATGYMYSYPFLQNLSPLPPVCSSGLRVENIYFNMIYHPAPTLFFTGLPQRVVPFPIAEAQMAAIARVLSGRLQLPSGKAMHAEEQQRLAGRVDDKAFHDMKFPEDVDYINSLHCWASLAQRNVILENDGIGKLPAHWNEDKRWLRSIMPEVKAASRLLGDRRHKIKTLAELGFEFEKSKLGKI
ncbi:putative flavin dependent monooxygenase [Bisporella sp. PMI_857]|nr:putative flavin dependent monooxygenase [Bisporella sp. PMI_857]